MNFVLVFFSILTLTLFSHDYLSQSPPGIPYQAEVRNESGDVLANANVNIRFTLHELTASGAVSYQETHALTTNELGLFAATIGAGTATQGTFAGINWAQTNKFLQVEADAGNGYITMGNQQLMSVPYAMYAGSSGSNNYYPPTEYYQAPITATLNDAINYCATLVLNNKSDWRLPTLEEVDILRETNHPEIANNYGFWTKSYTFSSTSYISITSERGAINVGQYPSSQRVFICIR